ncbi:MAG TPA: FtsQ-type POTRA domain-containing protein [Rariglobus sp.]|jgi:cell division protein FtsQ|nr:FtsQ-type POTRA domain-containing protein [Rariglobus sp.]
MSQLTLNPPPTRTWRDIPQTVTPRAMSREGKKRLVFAVGNIVGIVLVLGAAGWGVYELVSVWETNPTRITAAASSVPLRDVTLRTDGVLDKSWVMRTLDLPKDASLMELDLSALQNRLLATGQVQSAVVARKFPDILTVTLQERSPVARVMAQLGSAAPQAYMVSRDGAVYQGSGYDQRLADTLPFLDGVKLVRSGDGFARIDGMDQVSDLLGTARTSTPALYHTFRVVSLARFNVDSTITVKSTEVDAITFGVASDGFYRQLARLDYILDETRRQNPPQPLKAVNLAVGGSQVPVAFGAAGASDDGNNPRTTTVSKTAAPAPFGTALFSLPSRNSSPSKRDF